jgi:hypothetical protein
VQSRMVPVAVREERSVVARRLSEICIEVSLIFGKKLNRKRRRFIKFFYHKLAILHDLRG